MSNLKTVLEGFSGFVAAEIAAAGVLKGDGRPDLKPEMDGKPKGTIYKDNSVTDGAVLWLKTGNGRSWKVISGDTGWLTVRRTNSLAASSTIKIRRMGGTVFWAFGGGQWGWFGITRRGGQGYDGHGSFGNKGCKIVQVGGIPDGFKTPNSVVGSMYKDGLKQYGTIYLGGMSDSNYIAVGFIDDIPTDRETLDIRVSALNYPTDQEWPRLDVLRNQGFI